MRESTLLAWAGEDGQEGRAEAAGRLACVLQGGPAAVCGLRPPGKDGPGHARALTPPPRHCPPVWVTVTAISVETPREVLRAARGRSVTLPCTYRTSVTERKGFIQWDKLLWSHSVRSRAARVGQVGRGSSGFPWRQNRSQSVPGSV